MRIAIIADIHGNLVALDSVLADIEQARVDATVCLGDVAAMGPQPREVLARLRTSGMPVVYGNADAELLEPQYEMGNDDDSRKFFELSAWCAGLLTPDDQQYIRSFRPTVELPLGDDAKLLCFHGSPRSFDERILATTPDADLAPMMKGVNATVLAGGHTHVQLVRRYQGAIVMNPGSVGMPYETLASGQLRNPPWAEYAIVASDAGRLSVDLRRVPLDPRAVVTAMYASDMPHAAWMAADWVV